MFKQNTVEGNIVAANLLDLSKAFDAMIHDSLLAKLRALRVYLLNHKQRVKLSDTYIDWDTIIHGIPQGSILGSILLNCFIDNLFYFFKHHNYADDSTLVLPA